MECLASHSYSEDLVFLNNALTRVNFSVCLIVPSEWNEEVRAHFLPFIEKLGFLRDKDNYYHFNYGDAVSFFFCFFL
jgi:hypothetical protein